MKKLSTHRRPLRNVRAGLLWLCVLISVSVQAQNLTQSGFISVLTPQFMANGTGTRLPVMYRATVTGLTPGTTYRFYTQAAISDNLGGTNPGAGNPLLVNTAGTSYTYTSSPSVTTTGGYESFTTDASGNYTGWFGFVNTGNARFDPGNLILPTIVIANTSGTILSRRALDASIRVLAYSTSAGTNNGSFLKESTSGANGKNLVAIYDNTAGTGRPLFIAPAESIGTTIASVVPGYTTSAGGWNAIVPNDNANGVRRIEQLSSANASLIGCATDDDGVWPTGTVNTANPTAGTSGLTIASEDAALTSCTSLPVVNLSVSSNAGSEAAQNVITVTATASAPVTGDQTVNLSVSGTGISASDYVLSGSTITIPTGATTGSVTFTIADDSDAENTETATLTISSPSAGITLGSTTAQSITITDNDGAPNDNAPVIVADNETTTDADLTTTYLSVPDNSPVANPAAFVSGVINDPTDPARTLGIEFNVSDVETAASALVVTATSSNTAVVPDANLSVTTGNANSRNLKITPVGVGYADITVTVTDGGLSSAYVIKYAASAASGTPSSTRFHTQVSDASTAQAIDSDYMLVADDENQVLRLYNRQNSGLPVNGFDYTGSLGLTDISGGVPREVDIESSVMIGNRIYWMGSHSNASGGNNRPNRSRVFATDLSGTGAAVTLSYVGRYDALKTDLLAWDASNGNVLGLAASAAAGKIPEDPALDGFNIEGLTVGPDGTTGYIGFRAPYQSTSTRTLALIVPWTNITSLFSGNPTSGPATFGAPIQLDLGGRGIREIKKNAAGEYLILAGPADAATGTAPKDFRFYTWTGNPADAPVLRSANLTALNAQGSFESIVDLPSPLANNSEIQVLVDNGDDVFYNDGTIAKDLGQSNYKKFRSERIVLGNPPVVATRIHQIQGSGNTAALTGPLTIEGVVTRTFTGSTGLNGFYVQEEDADADADPTTSEGIFVYNVAADPAGVVSVTQGDLVRISGEVIDFVSTTSGFTTSLTELKTVSAFEKLGTAPLPTITNVTLPVANVADLERYEGMLVNLNATSGNLFVTEYFQLGRYGQVVLSADGPGNAAGTDGRLDQYTQFNAPSVAGYAAYVAEAAKRKIYLDDGRTTQNPDPVIFGRGGNPLSATNTLRGGDQVTSVIGILDDRLEGYRIQTSSGVNFIAANERPTAPPALGTGATLKVASANVLNYFNGNGAGGGFPTSRGADTQAEFARQRAKVIEALYTSDADVIGLMELERDDYGPNSAIQDLVNGLNTRAGVSGTYAFIDPGTIATDEITVGLIYKPGKVTPDGAAATMPDHYGQTSPGYPTGQTAFDVVGRKPLAQTFIETASTEKFTVVVNHFKSKSSSANGEGDADAGDGQGESNGTRVRQAQDLVAWLATKPTGTTDTDYLILGDLNAYLKEEPLTILANAGYNSVLPATSYSYVFDGFTGSLDHALATSSLAKQVTGADKYHINADEPSVLDYNTEFKSAGQVTSFYSADQYRASDHDPVLVGLHLEPALPVHLISFTATSGERNVTLQWATTWEEQNEGFDILRSTDGVNFSAIAFVAGNATTSSRSEYAWTDSDVQAGILYYYRLRQRDWDGTTTLSRIVAARVDAGAGTTAFVYPNPNSGNFTVSAPGASTLELYNAAGRQVPIHVKAIGTEGLFLVNIKGQAAPGMYNLIIERTNSGKSGSVKVIVE
ncbi:MAG: ExeM/NucH family extracellular endonuclease [Dyadobacter sp.]|uniref:ExeM/NucH family extracellular endonuclease n=1 Tax=Dyadobacter sp. TaxID=1914288 RepID=UPI001B1FE435|nr:ExeM/NucH family extracellular endonuclease [Dyadobacter sp.]MBO9611616.1 ExeM/NucH family extracellular endonuclease [Dyadobacter sp.]